MSFKCTFCQCIFSRRSTYSRHVNKCILTVKSSDESSDESKEYHSLNASKSSTVGNTPECFEDFNIISNSSNVCIFSFFVYLLVFLLLHFNNF
jgi:hypothetical protein